MNVLLLDKLCGQYYTRYWSRLLQNRGHVVDAGNSLAGIIKEESDLSKYQVAIAHPTFEDARKLYDEIQRRKDFRVILNSGMNILTELPELESLRMRGSSQLYYVMFLESDDLIKLVEEGWS